MEKVVAFAHGKEGRRCSRVERKEKGDVFASRKDGKGEGEERVGVGGEEGGVGERKGKWDLFGFWGKRETEVKRKRGKERKSRRGEKN